NASASWAKEEQLFVFHVAQPWMFDKPILGALDIYHRRPTYDELRNITPNPVHERLSGGSIMGGALTPPTWPLFADTRAIGSFGFDAIRYQQIPVASISPLYFNSVAVAATANAEYQQILNKSFDPGDFLWLGGAFEQDTRNHPVHTSHGHKWKIYARFAMPTFEKDIGFYKLSLDAQWFTPLIGEYDLVLKLHGYAGAAVPLRNRTIPFGELFHIGGDNSVRGFLFGQIGPQFLGSTIGGKKALFVNVELIFPLLPDMSVKALVFYDGGAGWDNPYTQGVSGAFLEGNRFDYRHSVGFGLRLLKPMPIRVDWGFKIDPRKDRTDPALGESASEVHFGMSYAFD
ncbi:MAG TPA: BamA/TamA family outer membrane protein, partial [Candidatus Bathyarchaeia archaeon]|nr:BamA/TamA family outer membrane protein [Candidatus Bathyarchaeia archaeon]